MRRSDNECKYLHRAFFACRAVVMLGLPYPNPSSPEMKEKMKYFEARGLLVCL